MEINRRWRLSFLTGEGQDILEWYATEAEANRWAQWIRDGIAQNRNDSFPCKQGRVPLYDIRPDSIEVRYFAP